MGALTCTPRPMVTALSLKPGGGLGNRVGASGRSALTRSHVGGY